MSLSHSQLKVDGTAILRSGLLLLVFALTGCRSPGPPPPTDRALMWPPSPAPPRIAYEMSISTPSDFGIRRRWWKTAVGYLTGNDRKDFAFITPAGICVDESGSLCVTDTGSKTVWFFDAERTYYKHWSRIGKVAFSSPVAVAMKDDVFYVADSGLGAVIVFNKKGKLLFTITDGLSRPSGLTIIGEALYVTDAALHRIEIFDLQGRYINGFGQRGTAPGEFNYPTHLTSAPGEVSSLYVTDAMNFRVQQVDTRGLPLQSIGRIGNVTGSFSRPKGVATDREGNLYVVDSLFDNIQIFDDQGRFLMHWGESGTEPGCFGLPRGIAIDRHDRIWVADAYNRRIQVFKRMTDYEED